MAHSLILLFIYSVFTRRLNGLVCVSEGGNLGEISGSYGTEHELGQQNEVLWMSHFSPIILQVKTDGDGVKPIKYAGKTGKMYRTVRTPSKVMDKQVRKKSSYVHRSLKRGASKADKRMRKGTSIAHKLFKRGVIGLNRKFTRSSKKERNSLSRTSTWLDHRLVAGTRKTHHTVKHALISLDKGVAKRSTKAYGKVKKKVTKVDKRLKKGAREYDERRLLHKKKGSSSKGKKDKSVAPLPAPNVERDENKIIEQQVEEEPIVNKEEIIIPPSIDIPSTMSQNKNYQVAETVPSNDEENKEREGDDSEGGKVKKGEGEEQRKEQEKESGEGGEKENSRDEVEREEKREKEEEREKEEGKEKKGEIEEGKEEDDDKDKDKQKREDLRKNEEEEEGRDISKRDEDEVKVEQEKEERENREKEAKHQLRTIKEEKDEQKEETKDEIEDEEEDEEEEEEEEENEEEIEEEEDDEDEDEEDEGVDEEEGEENEEVEKLEREREKDKQIERENKNEKEKLKNLEDVQNLQFWDTKHKNFPSSRQGESVDSRGNLKHTSPGSETQTMGSNEKKRHFQLDKDNNIVVLQGGVTRNNSNTSSKSLPAGLRLFSKTSEAQSLPPRNTYPSLAANRRISNRILNSSPTINNQPRQRV